MKRAVVAVLREDQRAAVRRVVNLTAQLAPCDARFCDAFIVDISTDGFKASVEGEVNVDEQAWVQLPGLPPKRCRAVWQRDGDTGFAFVEPISLDDVECVRRVGRKTWPKGHFGPRPR